MRGGPDGNRDSAVRDPGYLDRAERYAGRPFAYREDLAWMVSAGGDPVRAEAFEEAIFLAGFIVRAQGVLRRTGPEAADVENLTAELTAALGKLAALVEKMCPPDNLREVRSKYLALEGASFTNLQGIIAEMAILKNFEMDAK